ncbi:MAG: metallophosphoesterase family protein [Planctomycetota bacterium]|jgi:predicted phosphodiesterase
MLQAIISDIHSNIPALTAVLKDIEQHKPDYIVCLGDSVGYGPQPKEALQMIRKNCKVILMGNHEHAVLNGAEHFTPLAQMAIDWTAQQLRDPEIINFLSNLEPAKRINNNMYVHGSLRDPILDYVREADSPWMFHRLIQTLHEDFQDIDLCFVGHNHRAFLGTEVGYIFPHDEGENPQTKFNVAGQKAYVSVGSVGQPRDGDPRSSYALFDGESVEYHRVRYDAEKTAAMIREVGLPEFLADRLIYGE